MIRFGDEFDLDQLTELIGLKLKNEFMMILGTVVDVELETVPCYNRTVAYLVLDNGKRVDATYLGGS